MTPESNLPALKTVVISCLLGIMLTININSTAQVIGSWNFNGSLAGTPGSFNTVSAADFSPAVPTRAFNAGAEYYGHNGWPTGTIDTDFYLSFTLSPNSGYALNILSLNLRLRHSNTGSSGGSGPKQFTIRSSLDGYVADIASGAITSAYSNFIFAPGAAFNNLPTPVTFRVYGHNSVLYSGGNNRFVFDNLQVEAIGIVLPSKLLSFNASAAINKVQIRYHLNDVAAETQLILERSTDQITYKIIASETEEGFISGKIYSHNDVQLPPGIGQLYYRLRIITADGTVNYSKVVPVSIPQPNRKLTVIYNRNSLVLNGLSPGASRLLIFSSEGRMVFSYSLNRVPGQITIHNLPSLPHGIYYLTIVGLDVNQQASFAL